MAVCAVGADSGEAGNYFNNAAVAVRAAQRAGARRVMLIDWWVGFRGVALLVINEVHKRTEPYMFPPHAVRMAVCRQYIITACCSCKHCNWRYRTYTGSTGSTTACSELQAV